MANASAHLSNRRPPEADVALDHLAAGGDLDDLVTAALEAGATTREIAAVLECDPRTVARRWGCQPRLGPRDRWDVQDQDVLDLASRGLSQREIAETLSGERDAPVSRSLVRRRLARYNLASE